MYNDFIDSNLPSDDELINDSIKVVEDYFKERDKKVRKEKLLFLFSFLCVVISVLSLIISIIALLK